VEDPPIEGGFPLSLLDRLVSLLKGAAYIVAAAFVGFIAYLLGMAGISLMGLWIVGLILLMFDLGAWLFTLYLVLLGLGNLASAIGGRMPVKMRSANEQFEA
jgi:hypothetical protein